MNGNNVTKVWLNLLESQLGKGFHAIITESKTLLPTGNLKILTIKFALYNFL